MPALAGVAAGDDRGLEALFGTQAARQASTSKRPAMFEEAQYILRLRGIGAFDDCPPDLAITRSPDGVLSAPLAALGERSGAPSSLRDSSFVMTDYRTTNSVRGIK